MDFMMNFFNTALYFSFAFVSSGTSGTSGASGTSGTSGASGTLGTSGASTFGASGTGVPGETSTARGAPSASGRVPTDTGGAGNNSTAGGAPSTYGGAPIDTGVAGNTSTAEGAPRKSTAGSSTTTGTSSPGSGWLDLAEDVRRSPVLYYRLGPLHGEQEEGQGNVQNQSPQQQNMRNQHPQPHNVANVAQQQQNVAAHWFKRMTIKSHVALIVFGGIGGIFLGAAGNQFLGSPQTKKSVLLGLLFTILAVFVCLVPFIALVLKFKNGVNEVVLYKVCCSTCQNDCSGIDSFISS